MMANSEVKTGSLGLPSLFSGYDSVLPMKGALVGHLVEEIRSYIPP